MGTSNAMKISKWIELASQIMA